MGWIRLLCLMHFIGVGSAAVQPLEIASADFDFVKRVNYGSSAVFIGDFDQFSVHANGDSNSARQTWFRMGNAVKRVTAGRGLISAKLIFENGTEGTSPARAFLSRIPLVVTAEADRMTLDGQQSYPSPPGSAESFSQYLLDPLKLDLDEKGSGSVDVTEWVRKNRDEVWFLTASSAADGGKVDEISGANWSARWHWKTLGVSRPSIPS